MMTLLIHYIRHPLAVNILLANTFFRYELNKRKVTPTVLAFTRLILPFRLTITMSCKLNLRRFPHDIQKCTLELESCKLTFMTVLDLMSLSLSYLNSPFIILNGLQRHFDFTKGQGSGKICSL